MKKGIFIALLFSVILNLNASGNDLEEWNLNINVSSETETSINNIELIFYNSEGHKVDSKLFNNTIKIKFKKEGVHALRIQKEGYNSLYIPYLDEKLLKDKLMLYVSLGKQESKVSTDNKDFKEISRIANSISDFEMNTMMTLMSLYKDQDKPSKQTIDFTAKTKEIERQLKNLSKQKNSIAYQLKLFEYLSYEGIKAKIEIEGLTIKTNLKDEYINDVLNYISPKSNLFHIYPEVFYVVANHLKKEYSKVANYINAVVETNETYTIKTAALRYLIGVEHSLGLENKYKASIARLISYFPIGIHTVKVKEIYNVENSLQIGNTIPNFKIKSLSNSVTNNKDLDPNKLYIIHFWNTKCGGSLNVLKKINENYSSELRDKIEILNFLVDENEEALNKFKKENYNPVGHLLLIEGDFTSKTAVDFDVAYLPKTILIDGSGKILAQKDAFRSFNFKEIIKKYYK